MLFSFEFYIGWYIEYNMLKQDEYNHPQNREKKNMNWGR